MPSQPEQIIAAFDECLDYVYGRRYGRNNPHTSDIATAIRWIAAGLTLPVACFVFYRQMNLMHERWMRDDLKDRAHIPHSLKVFDEAIDSAIRRARDGEVSTWDLEDSRWRARLTGWKRKSSFWLEDHWGPPPGSPGCRVPGAVRREHCA